MMSPRKDDRQWNDNHNDDTNESSHETEDAPRFLARGLGVVHSLESSEESHEINRR